MTEHEIYLTFAQSYELSSWHDPTNAKVRQAFILSMKGRQYGYEALRDAWGWFLEGYTRGKGNRSH